MKHMHQIVARWRSEAVHDVAPETASTVKTAFQSLGHAVATDLIALYEQTGGMLMMDGNYFRLWPLSEIRAENKSPSPDGVLFADYLIDSWRYRIKAVSDSESMVYVDHCDGNPLVATGRNLSDFLRCCLADPDSVLHHRAHHLSPQPGCHE